MDILTSLIIIPALTVLALLFTKGLKNVRVIAAIGMTIQLLQSIRLVFIYLAERASGNDSEMILKKSYQWFESINIQYAVGVDGISVLMILLTGIIIFTGIFTSWKMEYLSKEFFISLIVLATGVFGFFISLDLFTLFLFYELAVLPMYLLIGIWGTGKKEYSAMKLTLMLMGGSALLLVGLLGIYFNSAPDGGQLTFNLLEIAKVTIPIEAQRFFFPLTFIGFGVLGALFPFHTWSPDGHASAPTAVSMLHAGVLMKLGGYGAFRVAKMATDIMLKNNDGGSIINIASILAERVGLNLSSYASAKAALVQLTKSMALELARSNIRVNALAPGYILTEINQDFFNTDEGKSYIGKIPMKRLGLESELDGALLLLASNTSSFMTGSVITVDGGHLVNPL